MLDTGAVDQDVEADLQPGKGFSVGEIERPGIAAELGRQRALGTVGVDVGHPHGGATTREMRAIAAPIPLAPPVINADRPSRARDCPFMITSFPAAPTAREH